MFKVLIVSHPRCQVSIGTIRILKISFKYCQIIIGKDFKTGRSTGCIHDDDDDDPVKSKSSSSSYPYKLIIALDGSWSHAKIMYRCNPRLQQLIQVKFPSPPQSIYHALKPEPKVTYTSTAEAVGQAVALLGWSSNLSDAQLLLEDLIRPLKKMIEIQDMIAKDQQK
ncbi:hypothetical protein BGZ65_002532 [Modicella reniformis]|uniref:tRNA-uridine aminocarboxypropyltransferase n=1 Tax=Modicella reniformis TaxID=1440133 RepID=A0A9P6M9L8_9FUNG|nr:hypothetical protein BGZ65_002532 [Modicella reniformis]